jgi:hypothetical protein
LHQRPARGSHGAGTAAWKALAQEAWIDERDARRGTLSGDEDTSTPRPNSDAHGRVDPGWPWPWSSPATATDRHHARTAGRVILVARHSSRVAYRTALNMAGRCAGMCVQRAILHSACTAHASPAFPEDIFTRYCARPDVGTCTAADRSSRFELLGSSRDACEKAQIVRRQAPARTRAGGHGRHFNLKGSRPHPHQTTCLMEALYQTLTPTHSVGCDAARPLHEAAVLAY